MSLRGQHFVSVCLCYSFHMYCSVLVTYLPILSVTLHINCNCIQMFSCEPLQRANSSRACKWNLTGFFIVYIKYVYEYMFTREWSFLILFPSLIECYLFCCRSLSLFLCIFGVACAFPLFLKHVVRFLNNYFNSFSTFIVFTEQRASSISEQSHEKR